MSQLVEQLEAAKNALIERSGGFPKIVIVLGSGLGGLIDSLAIEKEIPFSDIPHFKTPTVQGHSGRILIASLNGVRVALIQGRLHSYEGHALSETVFPVRAYAKAGGEYFVLTNAAGGLDPAMSPPELVLIRDHINLMSGNPLVGKNESSLGPRFPDLTHVYDPELGDAMKAISRRLDIPLREGVYVAIQGPVYETPAEAKMYRMLGGDMVGMSTVPEAIALRHMGKKVIALSCITNVSAGGASEPLSHQEVLDNAHRVHKKLTSLLAEWVTGVGKHGDETSTTS